MARVLVVEDNGLVALIAAYHLEHAGFTVVGPAATVGVARELLRAVPCDAALLDYRLDGTQSTEPIARELADRGTPFVVVTGGSIDELPLAYNGAPFLSKPVRRDRLIDELRRCLGA
jgi:DNA-binding NtrC family response regulator